MKIKSIPTEYQGITYRSRTEARWAYFFTENRVPFRYEAEGFEMGGMRYLPDFWLPEGRCWFEVKPFAPTEPEIEKARRLAKATGHLVFIAPGAPARDIGLHVVSPTGRSKEDWRICYAHEEGVGYICDNDWNCTMQVRIAPGSNPPGMYGMGPEKELEEAGKHHFDWSPNRLSERGKVIHLPQRRALPPGVGRKRTLWGDR